mmetsp:Transcript_43826/g.103630  ORF Transcript_43826/g.103630 Transcript_43826/m.103630 type:complete len:536 (+) Transcript_43826:74-1681(+)
MLFVALVLAIFSEAHVAEADGASRPHIVTIIADDYGWANAGYHRQPGFKETVTPSIDALVREGIELDRFYAYHICSPSRSSFQSGRLAVHVNVKNYEPIVHNPKDPVGGYAGIPRNMTGVAQKMKQAGYRTHMTGKWDCGMATLRHTPQGRGYDSFFGYFHHANDYWTEKIGFSSTGGLDACQNQFVDLWDTDRPASRANGTVYEEELFENATLSVIQAHDPAVPLFLVHAFHIVHTPQQVPDEYLQNFSFIPVEDRRSYHAMVHYMDNVVGRITDALKAKKMWSNTLLVFFSDNGGPLYATTGANNYPLRGGKWSDFEGGLRVNAFASGGLIPASLAGTKYEGLISIADWYSTFAALAGVDSHDAEAASVGLPAVDGVNVWPHLTGAANASARQEIHLSTQALLQGKYKIIVGMEWFNLWPGEYYPTEEDETHRPSAPGHGMNYTLNCGKTGCLFNVFDDPHEKNNLASAQPALLETMRSRLHHLNKGFYNPNRGKESTMACKIAAEKYGGFYGPFILDDATVAERSAEEIITI